MTCITVEGEPSILMLAVISPTASPSVVHLCRYAKPLGPIINNNSLTLGQVPNLNGIERLSHAPRRLPDEHPRCMLVAAALLTVRWAVAFSPMYGVSVSVATSAPSTLKGAKRKGMYKEANKRKTMKYFTRKNANSASGYATYCLQPLWESCRPQSNLKKLTY